MAVLTSVCDFSDGSACSLLERGSRFNQQVTFRRTTATFKFRPLQPLGCSGLTGMRKYVDLFTPRRQSRWIVHWVDPRNSNQDSRSMDRNSYPNPSLVQLDGEYPSVEATTRPLVPMYLAFMEESGCSECYLSQRNGYLGACKMVSTVAEIRCRRTFFSTQKHQSMCSLSSKTRRTSTWISSIIQNNESVNLSEECHP